MRFGTRRPLLVAATLALAVAAGCAGPNHATFPPLGSTPGPVGAATDAT